MASWHQDFEYFVRDVDEADSFGQLGDVCMRHFRLWNVARASYSHLPPPGALDYAPTIGVAASGFPSEWLSRYVKERLYESDPNPEMAFSKMEPVWWSEVMRDPRLTAAQRNFFDIFKQARLGDGLGVPLFGPFGRNGYAGLGFEGKRPSLSRMEILRLQWACQLGHNRYCHLLRDKAPEHIALSPRETEILSWIAKGKSNSVVADIIGISANTVDTHLKRIYNKLDVSDRVTAALRGLAIGLIGRPTHDR